MKLKVSDMISQREEMSDTSMLFDPVYGNMMKVGQVQEKVVSGGKRKNKRGGAIIIDPTNIPKPAGTNAKLK